MMPGDDERDPLDSWLSRQVHPLPPPPGTFELITRRARRRKLRKLAVTVASAAAVAAAVTVAVTNVPALHLTPSPVPVSVAAGQGSASSGTQQPESSASRHTSPSPAQAGPTGQAGPPGSVTAPPGPVPPNFQPASVTFIGTHRGWVLGQAGTPGHCANANPYICTSVAWTDDAGKTWHGAPAPGTGAPSGNTGVSGIRFLNERYGWAFGPELWATDDAGRTWAKVDTKGTRVIALETAGSRAFAVWATCTGATVPGGPGTALDTTAGCTSFTLMTTVAGSGRWSAAGAATTGLTPGQTSPVLALSTTTGYLLAPDGAVYSGPLDGPWQQAVTTICGTLVAPPLGPPPYQLLALVNSATPVIACSPQLGQAGAGVRVYTSATGGADWVKQPVSAWSGGVAQPVGGLVSLAAAPDGTLLLAGDAKYAGGSLNVLPAGSSQWQRAAVKNRPDGGFRYVGMTTSTQGVALPADTSLHEIWMTFDGGLTWAPATPITPGN